MHIFIIVLGTWRCCDRRDESCSITNVKLFVQSGDVNERSEESDRADDQQRNDEEEEGGGEENEIKLHSLVGSITARFSR